MQELWIQTRGFSFPLGLPFEIKAANSQSNSHSNRSNNSNRSKQGMHSGLRTTPPRPLPRLLLLPLPIPLPLLLLLAPHPRPTLSPVLHLTLSPSLDPTPPPTPTLTQISPARRRQICHIGILEFQCLGMRIAKLKRCCFVEVIEDLGIDFIGSDAVVIT